ncbi:MAG TPA: plasmid stabilization protein [Campylobacterales bacterium]|nr:plasmid stabilization protein [Campylobacterales bacterium]
MPYKLIYPESYNKKATKFIKKHRDLKNQYEKTLKLLEIDPYHPSLRLHKLQGRLEKLHSISINITYRITIDFIIREGEIIMIDVGHHDSVY